MLFFVIILSAMRKAYNFRLYPNKVQRETLDSIFSFCQFFYNCALEERILYYKTFGKGIGYNKQSSYLPEIKKLFPQETANINGQVLQQILKHLDKAYKNFFRRIKKGMKEPGFPRFKSKDRFRSICFPQVNHDLSSSQGKGGIIRRANNKLYVSGLPGELKVKWHRPLQGRVKQALIIKKGEQY